MRATNLACASVSKPHLLREIAGKQSGGPLHQSSGLINRFYDNIRDRIRSYEADEEYMIQMQLSKEEVKGMLDRLEITVPKSRQKDPQFNSIMIPIH